MHRENGEFDDYEEVNLIKYVNALLKRRWLIVGGTLFFVILAVLYSLSLTPLFKATAKFFPSRNPEMTSRMGNIIGSGQIETYEENVTSAYYAELLSSAPFLERIAQRKFSSQGHGEEVDLFTFYEIEETAETGRRGAVIKAIREYLAVSTARQTGVITLGYTTAEPGLSADIVNAFLEELVLYNQSLRNSKAKINREFVQSQLDENRKLLDDAETVLANFTAKNKKIVTPDLEVEQDRLQRRVKIQEEVNITLTKQLELAKIEEKEQTPIIEIIERASPPLQKSSPRIRLNVILAGIVSLFFFVFLAFVLEYVSSLDRKEKEYREFFGHLENIKNEILFFRKSTRKKP